jgi:hypothetical protein
MNITKYLRLASTAVAAVVLLLFIYTDLAMPKLVAISDYTTTFYVSGRLLLERRLAELYPAGTDTSLAATAYNHAAHKVLDGLPPEITAIFPYPPIVALLLSPLALLPANLALLVFQMLCLSALCSAASFLRNRSLCLIGFLFMPIVLTMWVGQLGIIAGILVYAAGYYVLRKDRPILAGLVWSLSLLKPQFALVPVVVAVAWLCTRRWQLIAGCGIGSLILAALNLLMFGPNIIQSWLGAMKLTESVYLMPTAGVARHIAVSVPRLILFSVPSEDLASWRIAVYAMSLVIVAVAVAATAVFARKADIRLATDAAIVVSCLAIPLVAPHLFYYDLCVLFFAGAVWSSNRFPEPMDGWVRKWTILLWITISLYPLLFIVSKSMYLPLLILVPLSAAFAHILILLDTFTKEDKS